MCDSVIVRTTKTLALEDRSRQNLSIDTSLGGFFLHPPPLWRKSVSKFARRGFVCYRSCCTVQTRFQILCVYDSRLYIPPCAHLLLPQKSNGHEIKQFHPQKRGQHFCLPSAVSHQQFGERVVEQPVRPPRFDRPSSGGQTRRERHDVVSREVGPIRVVSPPG